MAQLAAGFGKTVITPTVGAPLMGYANRPGPSVGVHDDLYARAMVVRAGAKSWALCAVDLCYVRESTVRAVRQQVAQQTDLQPSQICVAAVHTHSGPDDQDTTCWQRPLAESIAAAILEAHRRLVPARIGAGFGALHGHSINRRRLERPVDPALGVIRVDDAAGKALGMVINFGCHAVVLGSDNLLISADWPGATAGRVEAALGHGAVCLVTQGGSADVNPLTAGVRSRLNDGTAIVSGLSRYHGRKGDPGAWDIYDRGGGTFEEVADVGQAVANEALRAAAGIETGGEVERVWATQVTVNGARRPDAPAFPMPDQLFKHLTERPTPPPDAANIPLEVMGLGIDGPGILLVTQPGEVFAETAIGLRKALQSQGYPYPLVLGYANDWQAYLPPFDALLEGGYEASWPALLGLDPRIQDYLRDAVQEIMAQHVEQQI